ncbi:MAG: hypothetical protein WCO02_10980 [Bacteroidota bacterium]
MSEQNRVKEFTTWVDNISRKKINLEKLRNEQSEQDLALFKEYVEEQIILQMRSVNAIYLSNPAWKYGKDFTIEELEKLKKVRASLEQI